MEQATSVSGDANKNIELRHQKVVNAEACVSRGGLLQRTPGKSIAGTWELKARFNKQESGDSDFQLATQQQYQTSVCRKVKRNMSSSRALSVTGCL